MFVSVSVNTLSGFSRRQNFANRRSKIFAWTKFRESACFSPNFFHFPRSFGKNFNFKNFAWTKFREIGQNTRKSRKLIHVKFNPLKVQRLQTFDVILYHETLTQSPQALRIDRCTTYKWAPILRRF